VISKAPVTSTESTLFTLFHISFGIVSIYNHVMCHAGSRGYVVPGWVSGLRRLGIIPDMEWHRQHHDPDSPNPHMHRHYRPTHVLKKRYYLSISHQSIVNKCCRTNYNNITFKNIHLIVDALYVEGRTTYQLVAFLASKESQFLVD
jgi:hypothetical protein